MIRYSKLASKYVADTKVTFNFPKSPHTNYYKIAGPSVVVIVFLGVNTVTSFSHLNTYFLSLHSLYLSYLLYTLALTWLSMLNLCLIIICNPSIVNPGPVNKNNNLGSLSVYYQNVQGLIPFSHLSDKNPKFDETKMCELQNYIHASLPDVLILNETWLKPSIDSSEIFPSHLYHTFRSDRSQNTHPRDYTNPKKFPENGGGVLVSIKKSLSLMVNNIDVKFNAELLAAELILEDKSKIIIVTCYRVGTLGIDNANEIPSAIRTLIRKKSVRKFIMVGDLNLKGINWEDGIGKSNIENVLLNGFAECGLIQCVKTATHNKGILDVVLTSSVNFLSNLKVHDENIVCNSDHYPITFDIKVKFKRIKVPKRQCYNYSKANWSVLNRELGSISWHSVLDCMDPESSWSIFSKILSFHVEKFVPKMTVKNKDKPPWFDTECFQKCKEKDKLHIICKIKI